jgi:hypothetical protein
MTIDIQVQAGQVTITVGGQSASSAGADEIAAQANVGDAGNGGKKGGDGAAADPGTGGGGPNCGALVIGPIVVDGSVLQGANGQANANGGKKAGDGAAADPGTGGGGTCSGVVVIGPIVFGGQSKGAAATPHSKPVAIDPGA